MEQEKEKKFGETLNNFEILDSLGIHKRKPIMDGEDREFYKSMIEDLNTDKKSKAQKKEKNKKMLEKICSNNENLLVKLEFSSIIQDNNEIYELNIEKVSLESERITNLRFFTSQ